MARLRLAACQIDTVVGDLHGNADRVLAAGEADRQGADLAIFPELTITGYPPEDLLSRPSFVTENQAVLAAVAAATGPCAAVVGFVGTDPAGRLVNAVALCANGSVVGRYGKRLLPNYGVFDEQRWFVPGAEPLVPYLVAGVPVGLTVCEDVWSSRGPVAAQAAAGARLVVNVNASPYSMGRRAERLAVLADRVAEAGCAIAYVNQVGGRTSWSSTAVPWCSELTGACWPQVRSSPKTSWSWTSTSTSRRPPAVVPTVPTSPIGRRRPYGPTRSW